MEENIRDLENQRHELDKKIKQYYEKEEMCRIRHNEEKYVGKCYKIDDGEYYGFTLDGNGRFLLGDFTITHNTSTAIKSMSLIPEDKKILLTAFNNSIVDELKKKVKKFLQILKTCKLLVKIQKKKQKYL